ncbi:MAG: glycosyltransferase family 4 protein [Bacteroidota bacterium]
MKILFLTNKVPWPLKDGGAIGTFNLAYALATIGCDVHMLSINTSKHPVSKKDIPDNVLEKIKLETVDVNTEIKALSLLKNYLFSTKPYIAERFESKDYAEKLKDILSKEDFDLVILEILYMAEYIPVIRKYSNAHISFHAPNIEHEIWKKVARHEKKPVKSIYLKSLARRIEAYEYRKLNTWDSLVPVAETNARTYKNMGVTVPVHVAKIGMFFDHMDSQKTEPKTENQPSIGHIGALDWIPNLEGLSWFLNDIWPLIHKARPDVTFRIAGRNAAPGLKQKFSSPGVEYLGEVSDAYQFIQEQDIMIVPLLSGSGMRVKIIEALALGKTMVSTGKGAEGIDIAHGKHLLIADDSKKFADACVTLLNDPEKRKKLEENSQKFVRESYDNIRIARELYNFYQQVSG